MIGAYVLLVLLIGARTEGLHGRPDAGPSRAAPHPSLAFGPYRRGHQYPNLAAHPPIPRRCVDALREHRDRQDSARVAAGPDSPTTTSSSPPAPVVRWTRPTRSATRRQCPHRLGECTLGLGLACVTLQRPGHLIVGRLDDRREMMQRLTFSFRGLGDRPVQPVPGRRT
jgi:hypothetical protein